MDLPWGSDEAKQFVTNVGLITSHGPYGDNVMAAEWTHHVSYTPGIIVVCINPDDATHTNIVETKEFGVCLASEDQNVLSSIAGGQTGKEVNKITALQELCYTFSKGTKTSVLLMDGAALNLECTLLEHRDIGDHTMFIGQVVASHPLSGKRPVVYHSGKYWRVGENIAKPPPAELDRINAVIAKHRKA